MSLMQVLAVWKIRRRWISNISITEFTDALSQLETCSGVWTGALFDEYHNYLVVQQTHY